MTSRGEINQKRIEQFALALAKQYGLKGSEFAIELVITNKYDAAVKSDGASGIIRVDFCHLPGYSDFVGLMHRTLQQVKRVKDSKPGTAIDLFIGLKERSDEFRAAYKNFEEITPLLSEEEANISETFMLTAHHRETGITIKRECKLGKISESRLKLRIDLTELVALVREKLAKEEKKVETNEEKVTATQ